MAAGAPFAGFAFPYTENEELPMRLHRVSTGLFASLFVFCGSAFSGEEVPVDQLDASVKQAIDSKFPNAELLSAERETENGKTKHEVKIRQEGAVWEIDVIDGAIVETEREEDK
jgi:hypothetical protein